MNWPTIIAGAIVVALILAIVISGIRNKKKGKSSCSCGCSCSGCSMNGDCHPQK